MADTDLQNLQLVGRRVPDFSWETDSNGSRFQVELPGVFEIGFVMGDVFRPIHSFKAAGLLADMAALAKAKADAAAAPAAPAPSE